MSRSFRDLALEGLELRVEILGFGLRFGAETLGRRGRKTRADKPAMINTTNPPKPSTSTPKPYTLNTNP